MRWAVIGIILSISMFQAQSQDGFEVGGNLSINSTWILNQNAYEVFKLTCDDPGLWESQPNYQITVGYSVGASAAFRSGDFWGFMAELNYSKAGQNYKDGFTTTICPDHSNFQRKFTLHYFQMPLMAKFTATHRGDVKWYVLAGPQIGILLGAKETVTLSGNATTPGLLTPARQKVKTLDLDLVLGTGADIFLSDNLYINVGFKTYFGLVDINSKNVKQYIEENDATYQSSRNFNAGAHVGVHYIFDWVGKLYH
jgi:hypothetical protein